MKRIPNYYRFILWGSALLFFLLFGSGFYLLAFTWHEDIGASLIFLSLFVAIFYGIIAVNLESNIKDKIWKWDD